MTRFASKKNELLYFPISGKANEFPDRDDDDDEANVEVLKGRIIEWPNLSFGVCITSV